MKKYLTKKIQFDEFFANYIEEFSTQLRETSLSDLNEVISTIENCIDNDGSIYFCGNGGSAAIADHFVCDFMKGLGSDTGLSPRVHSLNSNMPIYSAIANDISFHDVFSHQIDKICRKGDLLITVSSSGNSENIICAIKSAKKKGMKTISFSGFTGGRSVESDLHVNVPADNYGIIEDAHHFLLHIIVQYLRVKHTRNLNELVL